MFDTLKSLLGGKPAPRKRAGSWNPNFITDPTRIVSVLNDLAQQQSALTLYPLEGDGLEKADEGITTYLYKIGTERAALRKAEPPEADARIRAERRFKAVAENFERIVSFRLEVLDIQQEDEMEYYIIAIPDRVYSPEPPQRPHFLEQKITVYLRFFDPPKSLPGVLDDLSPAGMGVILAGDEQVLPYIRRGDELRSCSVGLGNRQYRFDARVTQVRRINEKSMRLHCDFLSREEGLGEAIERLLGKS